MSIIREVHAAGPDFRETPAVDNPFIKALLKLHYIEGRWRIGHELDNLQMYQDWLDQCLIVATHIEGINGDDAQWQEFTARYNGEANNGE